ncbi:hypothetical protein [Nocardioides sp. B-3]|uniref:hypothetical protein n=1 Tax=Nocardioides sp. B-3 TaxID=2895565 RepID=UPI002152AF5E|nr:hypothetical protein [Nocardioides sp. B-3]UUZ58534.1 hypothetical protein LP418_20560 [Nocardioides sp. B-3]
MTGGRDLDGAGRAKPVVVPHRVEQGVGVAGVHTVEDKVTVDVGPRHPEVTGGGEDVAQTALVADVEGDVRCGTPGTAAVVGPDLHVEILRQHAPKGRGDPGELGRHAFHTTLS